MKKRIFITLIAALAFVTAFAQQPKVPFANEIAAFKHQDSINMPKPNGLLFIGSSSIRLWDDLHSRFGDKPIIQRGVGGSEIWQWVKFYAPDLIYPYKAKKIFIYAGENDIASGKPVEEVYQNTVALIDMIRQNSPVSKIYLLTIKQSPSRARRFAEVNEYNKKVAAYLAESKKAMLIDVNSPLLTATGAPDSTLFKKDFLHLNAQGYDKWEAALKKHVK